MSIEENIELEIKNMFYYIEYPDGVCNYLWKDRNGNILFTDEMTLDHLEKCIHLIKRDIGAFKKQWEIFTQKAEL